MIAQLACEQPAGEATPGRRILIAEDCEVTREFLRLVLTERGYLVESAQDGEEALQALRSRDFDVVLLDFHLPKLDGLEVAASFHAGRPGRRPRFIAITSDVRGLLAHSDSTEHFDRVVPKPFEIAQLCRLIDG